MARKRRLSVRDRGREIEVDIFAGGGQWQGVFEPMHTIDCNDRFGVVVVNVEGEPFVIVDIGMRMLRPRELARGQGFADSYVLTGSASSQVERIGNSVPPALAEAMVRANYSPRRVKVAA